jgi:hypothetical protein
VPLASVLHSWDGHFVNTNTPAQLYRDLALGHCIVLHHTILWKAPGISSLQRKGKGWATRPLYNTTPGPGRFKLPRNLLQSAPICSIATFSFVRRDYCPRIFNNALLVESQEYSQCVPILLDTNEIRLAPRRQETDNPESLLSKPKAKGGISE